MAEILTQLIRKNITFRIIIRKLYFFEERRINIHTQYLSKEYCCKMIHVIIFEKDFLFYRSKRNNYNQLKKTKQLQRKPYKYIKYQKVNSLIFKSGMGSLCVTELKEKSDNKESISNKGIQKISFETSETKFSNEENEKKYFFSMCTLTKIERKLEKIRKKRENGGNFPDLRILQIMQTCMQGYITQLQSIQESFTLYDQLYEESDKGYIESEYYSLQVDVESFQTYNGKVPLHIMTNNNSNIVANSNNIVNHYLSCPSKLERNQSESQSLEAEFFHRDAKSQSNCQPVKIVSRLSALSGTSELQTQLYTPPIDQNRILETNQNIQNNIDTIDNISQQNQNPEPNSIKSENPYHANDDNVKISDNTCNNQVQFNSSEANKIVTNRIEENKKINSMPKVTVINEFKLEDQIDCEDLSTQLINNKDSIKNVEYNDTQKENIIPSENEVIQNQAQENIQASLKNDNINNIDFKYEEMFDELRREEGQFKESSILSQNSFEDWAKIMGKQEIGNVFGRISEKLEQPVVVVEFHQLLAHSKKAKHCSARICLELIFEDNGKKQQEYFWTQPLFIEANSTPFVKINEIFEFLSDILFTSANSAMETKFRITLFCTPSSPITGQATTSNLLSIGFINKDKEVTPNKLHSQSQKEVKVSSQIVDLSKYLDQQIHYIDMVFDNKRPDPLTLSLQIRFQFVFDQRSLVNSLQTKLNSLKCVLDQFIV